MEPFPLITGIVCYLVGLVVGVYSIKGSLNKKIAQAKEEGKEHGRQESGAEKEAIGADIASKLGKLQSTLLDTLDAYQETVDTVEQKLSPEGTRQLALEYQATQKALPEATPSSGNARRSALSAEEGGDKEAANERGDEQPENLKKQQPENQGDALNNSEELSADSPNSEEKEDSSNGKNLDAAKLKESEKRTEFLH